LNIVRPDSIDNFIAEVDAEKCYESDLEESVFVTAYGNAGEIRAKEHGDKKRSIRSQHVGRCLDARNSGRIG
jgi:hypothetical protein